MAVDYFDFEQALLDCWGVTKDIDVVYSSLYENERIDNDQFANAMIGLKTLYEMKFEKTWAMFEEMVRERYEMKKRIDTLTESLNILIDKDRFTTRSEH